MMHIDWVSEILPGYEFISVRNCATKGPISIYKTDNEEFVISIHQVWIPGIYKTFIEANAAAEKELHN